MILAVRDSRMMLLAALIACSAADSALAQTNWRRSGSQKEAVCQGSCGGGCGPCSGSSSGGATSSSVPSGPSPELIKQQQDRQRLKAKAWSSDEALDYFDRKDWDNAIRSFEEALDRDPDDPDLNNWLKRAKAEKVKARMPILASPSRAAPDNDSKVVDTRGVPQAGADLLAQVPELQNSPAADRIRKGHQALLNRDWPLALAWWQDALNRDPNNGALKRSVGLAKWMVDRQREVRPGPVMLFGAANAAAADSNFARALELLQQVKTANPAMTGPADRLIAQIHKRIAALPVPGPDDMDMMVLFAPTSYAAAMNAVIQANYPRAIELFAEAKKDDPAMAATIEIMIGNVKLLALPLQFPDPDDVKLLFPELTYAGPMSGSGLELVADGYNKKAREVFNRIKLAMSRKAR